MDGRARWYRLRMCRPTSHHQHSRSASFDAGGGGQYEGGTDHTDAGDTEVGGTGTSRRRTTSAGDSVNRATSGAGRTATAALDSTIDVSVSLITLRLLVSFPLCRCPLGHCNSPN